MQSIVSEYKQTLFPGIDSLFNKINCDRSPIVEMLGDAGVTETNMMQVSPILLSCIFQGFSYGFNKPD